MVVRMRVWVWVWAVQVAKAVTVPQAEYVRGAA